MNLDKISRKLVAPQKLSRPWGQGHPQLKNLISSLLSKFYQIGQHPSSIKGAAGETMQ